MENGDIPEGFVIHHLNECKRDNSSGNLAALPANEHTPNAHYHWKTREADRENFIPIDDKNDGILF